MPTIQLPSGSSNGRPILVASTTSPGTMLHTVDTVLIDEVWVWLANNYNQPVNVVLVVGVSGSYQPIYLTLPVGGGLTLAMAGNRFTDVTEVRCYASVANVIVATVNVNRTDEVGT